MPTTKRRLLYICHSTEFDKMTNQQMGKVENIAYLAEGINIAEIRKTKYMK